MMRDGSRLAVCVLLGVLGVAVGCEDDQQYAGQEVECAPGEVFEFEGESFCIVIEDGFLAADCPEDFPEGQDVEEIVVCAQDEGELPEGFEEALADEGYIDDGGEGHEDGEGDTTRPGRTELVISAVVDGVSLMTPCNGDPNNFVSLGVNGLVVKPFVNVCLDCECNPECERAPTCDLDSPDVCNDLINLEVGTEYRWGWDNVGVLSVRPDPQEDVFCTEFLDVTAQDDVVATICRANDGPECEEFSIEIGQVNGIELQ